jgi:hypothetical protein
LLQISFGYIPFYAVRVDNPAGSRIKKTFVQLDVDNQLGFVCSSQLSMVTIQVDRNLAKKSLCFFMQVSLSFQSIVSYYHGETKRKRKNIAKGI